MGNKKTIPYYNSRFLNEKDKEDVVSWLSKINATHYITIQLPFETRTFNRESFNRGIRFIMRHFEKAMCGKLWTRFPLDFVLFAENQGTGWHAHIVANLVDYKTDCPFSMDKISDSLLKVSSEYSKYKQLLGRQLSVNVQEIGASEQDVKRVAGYSCKSVFCLDHFDNLVFAEEVLGLETGQIKTHYRCFGNSATSKQKASPQQKATPENSVRSDIAKVEKGQKQAKKGAAIISRWNIKSFCGRVWRGGSKVIRKLCRVVFHFYRI